MPSPEQIAAAAEKPEGLVEWDAYVRYLVEHPEVSQSDFILAPGRTGSSEALFLRCVLSGLNQRTPPVLRIATNKFGGAFPQQPIRLLDRFRDDKNYFKRVIGKRRPVLESHLSTGKITPGQGRQAGVKDFRDGYQEFIRFHPGGKGEIIIPDTFVENGSTLFQCGYALADLIAHGSPIRKIYLSISGVGFSSRVLENLDNLVKMGMDLYCVDADLRTDLSKAIEIVRLPEYKPQGYKPTWVHKIQEPKDPIFEIPYLHKTKPGVNSTSTFEKAEDASAVKMKLTRENRKQLAAVIQKMVSGSLKRIQSNG